MNQTSEQIYFLTYQNLAVNSLIHNGGHGTSTQKPTNQQFLMQSITQKY